MDKEKDQKIKELEFLQMRVFKNKKEIVDMCNELRDKAKMIQKKVKGL